MQLIATLSGYEVWAQHDTTADVWELFASSDGDDYLGCADTLAEARALAKGVLADKLSQ